MLIHRSVEQRRPVACWPFQVEPLDALLRQTGPDRVVLMFGRGLGKTEIAKTWLGMIPGPSAVVCAHPDEWSAGLGAVQVANLLAAGQIASIRPARHMVIDDAPWLQVDRGGEGDAVTLALARTALFARPRVLITGTPVDHGPHDTAQIVKHFADSDQRRWMVQCPSCGVWESAETLQADCPACDMSFDAEAIAGVVTGGRWCAMNPGHPVRGYALDLPANVVAAIRARKGEP